MANFNRSAYFTVKWREDYKVKKQTKFSAKEIGRYSNKNLVDIETWSKESGDRLPNECSVPIVNAPISLPMSLKLNRGFNNNTHLCLDVTNLHVTNNYEVKLPPKEIPECLPAMFSIEKSLTWALREKIDLDHVQFFIANDALEKIASSCYHRKHSSWEWSVIVYKGKIFIDEGYIKEDDKFWLKGLSKSAIDHSKKPLDPLNSKAAFNFHYQNSKADSSIPHCHFSAHFLQLQDLEKYSKRFEDVMKCGDLGDSLYDGEDTDVRSVILLNLEDMLVLTSSKRSCYIPCSDEYENNSVQFETMYPWDPLLWEKFKKFKSCSLWLKCTLTGTSAVYCGFRTADGILKEIKKYTTKELAEIGKDFWKPNEILTYLATVLNWLKTKLSTNSTRTKHGEEWLKSELDYEKGSTLNLSCAEDGFIRLTPGYYPEFKKVITEKFDWVLKNQESIKCDHRKSTSVSEDSDDNVPDNWDDSD